MNQNEAMDILAVIKAFFEAILKVFEALGIKFGAKEETDETTTA